MTLYTGNTKIDSLHFVYMLIIHNIRWLYMVIRPEMNPKQRVQLQRIYRMKEYHAIDK
jgi:hypothetical protein